MAMPLKGHRPPVTLFDKNTLAIDSVTIATVNRLCVDATLGGVVPVSETDDNSIAAGLISLLVLNENYGFDGTVWRRIGVGVDNAAAAATPQGVFVAGVARTALPVYANGDAVVPNFDVAGRLMVNMGGLAVEADDDSIAAAQDHETFIPLLYGYEPIGGVWRRLNVSAPGTTPVDERVMALMTSSFVRGINSAAAAGSQGVAVEARDLSATANISKTLVGLLGNSRINIYNQTTADWNFLGGDLASSVSGRATNTATGLYANAIAVGIDNTGAAVLRPIEARGAVNAQAISLVRLCTDTVLRGYDLTSVAYEMVNEDLASTIGGRTAASIRGICANALAVGVDNTAATVMRPVEARLGSGSVAPETTYGLVTNSRSLLYDGFSTSNYLRWHSCGQQSAGGTELERMNGALVYDARESGFAASRRGKRFVMTGQAPGTLITGGTAFVATAPALMLRINSISYRAIIRSIQIGIANTPGSPCYVTVAIDTSDRYSSGGTAVTPQNMNEESATATGVLAYDNSVAIVASAAGATTRYIANTVVPSSVGATVDIEFKDGVLLGMSAATLLVYVWAATTAPQFTYNIEFEDVT